MNFSVYFPSYIKKPGNEARVFNTLKGLNLADPLYFLCSDATVYGIHFHTLSLLSLNARAQVLQGKIQAGLIFISHPLDNYLMGTSCVPGSG